MTDRFTSHLPLDPARCALIVIDMQVGFLDPDEPFAVKAAPGIVPAINRLASAMRAAGGVVAYTRHTVIGDPDRALPAWERMLIPDAIAERFVPGAPSHALAPAIETGKEDLIVDKYRYSALAPRSSTLHDDLRARGIDTVIITGTMTNVCCESTARNAYSLDYRVLFAADATATDIPNAQAATLETLGRFFALVADTNALIEMLGQHRNHLPSMERNYA
jgi:ureidoacrylate peracid hydrolase